MNFMTCVVAIHVHKPEYGRGERMIEMLLPSEWYGINSLYVYQLETSMLVSTEKVPAYDEHAVHQSGPYNFRITHNSRLMKEHVACVGRHTAPLLPTSCSHIFKVPFYDYDLTEVSPR
jgi:hypothetical protein